MKIGPNTCERNIPQNVCRFLDDILLLIGAKDILASFSAKIQTFAGSQKLSTHRLKCSKLLEIGACKLEISKLEKGIYWLILTWHILQSRNRYSSLLVSPGKLPETENMRRRHAQTVFSAEDLTKLSKLSKSKHPEALKCWWPFGSKARRLRVEGKTLRGLK